MNDLPYLSRLLSRQACALMIADQLDADTDGKSVMAECRRVKLFPEKWLTHPRFVQREQFSSPSHLNFDLAHARHAFAALGLLEVLSRLFGFAVVS